MAPPWLPGAPQGRRAPSSPCWDHCRPCGMTGTCGTMGGMLYGCLQLLASTRPPNPTRNARGAPPWASASAGHAAQTCGASSTRTCRGARAGSAVLRAPGQAAAAAAAPAAPAGCPTRARAARWHSARARAASWSYVCEYSMRSCFIVKRKHTQTQTTSHQPPPEGPAIYILLITIFRHHSCNRAASSTTCATGYHT